MHARVCYPILSPLRVLICLLSLASLSAIYIGERFSAANEGLDNSAKSGTIPAKSSPHYFQDSTQIGIDFAMFFMAAFVFFRPQTSYWWVAGSVRRTIVGWTMAGLGAGYAINQLVQILTTGDPVYAEDGKTQVGISTSGCTAHVYDLTRGRCYIQMGVSVADMTWALLVVVECALWVIQRQDRVWHAQKANHEIQNAVLHQPTVEMNEVRVVAVSEGPHQLFEDVPASSVQDQVDETLPKYAYNDATNAPERLRGALAERLHGSSSSVSESPSSAAPPALAPSSTMPPSYTE